MAKGLTQRDGTNTKQIATAAQNAKMITFPEGVKTFDLIGENNLPVKIEIVIISNEPGQKKFSPEQLAEFRKLITAKLVDANIRIAEIENELKRIADLGLIGEDRSVMVLEKQKLLNDRSMCVSVKENSEKALRLIEEGVYGILDRSTSLEGLAPFYQMLVRPFATKSVAQK